MLQTIEGIVAAAAGGNGKSIFGDANIAAKSGRLEAQSPALRLFLRPLLDTSFTLHYLLHSVSLMEGTFTSSVRLLRIYKMLT